MVKEVIRFPRPLGTTALSIEYSNNPNEENAIKVYNYVIHQWMLNNGKFGNVSCDIKGLAKLINISPEYIQVYMRDQILNSKIWDPQLQNELVNGLLGQQLAWVLEDRMEINQQLDIMKNSQGGKYTPFISAELHKVLKLKLESSTSLQGLIRSFTGGTTTNIFTQINNTNQQEDSSGHISREEALQIVRESQYTLDDKSKEAKLLDTQYDIQSLPEVVATQQDNAGEYGASFNANQAELRSITDNYKEAIKVSSKEHHEQRREIEQNIDMDEIDPEFDIPDDYVDYQEVEPDSIASSYLNN